MTEDESFGQFRVIREIGRGGQGKVFLAEDTKLKRNVALKVLSAAPGDIPEAQLLRFRREAEAASKLDHAGICPVYEAGEVHGTPFIAMRYVEGQTLAQWIAMASEAPTGRDGIHETCELIERVARALHYAHENGLIHRDIKPGNIMLTGDREPVILDFGLARDELADQQTLTHSGDLLGTPAYMSPEQLMAQRVPIDRRTDVYSLGATLYECLTLRRPFEAATRAELYQKIARHEPTSVGSFNRGIPKDLQVVLETAMEKDRERRYQTADDFGSDLRRVRNLQPVRARPIGRVLRLRRWAQRHPAIAATAGLLLVALMVSLFLLARIQQEQQETLAQLRRATAGELVAEAERVVPKNPRFALALALGAYELDRNLSTLSFLHRMSSVPFPLAILGAQDVDRGTFLHPTASGDGSHVLAASPDAGLLLCWRVDPPEEVCRVTVRGAIRGSDAYISPDGSHFAYCSTEGTAHFAGHRGEVATLGSAERQVVGLAYHAAFRRGSELVVVYRDGTVETVGWNGARGQLLGEEPQFDQPLVTFTGSTNALVIADRRSAFLWSTRDAKTRHRVELPDRVGRLHASDDGNTVLLELRDGRAFVWKPELGRLKELEAGPCLRAGLRSDGLRILTEHATGRAILWDGDGRRVKQIENPSGEPLAHNYNVSMASPFNGGTRSRFFTVHESLTVALWDELGQARGHSRGHMGFSNQGLLFSESGEFLLHATESTTRVLDLQGHEVARCVADPRQGATRLAPYRGGFLVSTGWPGVEPQLYVWGLGSEALRHHLGHEGPVVALARTDAGVLFSGSFDGTCRIWKDGRFAGFLSRDSRHAVTSLALSDDQSLLAVGRRPGTIQIYDTNTLKPTRQPFRHPAKPGKGWIRLRFVGDHELRYRIDYNDDSWRVWDLRTNRHREFSSATPEERDRELIPGLKGHSDDNLPPLVKAAEFSPDGSKLATVSQDWTARIWDVASGRELAVLRGHEGAVRAVVWAGNNEIVTASEDQTIRRWFVDTNMLLDFLKKRQRPLTADELARYEAIIRPLRNLR